MNLLQAIKKEHSKAQCERIVRYIGSNRARFSQLVGLFLGGPYRVTQRAAWPLACCVELHPELIKAHLKQIINNLKKPGQHIAVKRNTIRLLQFIEIPKSLMGSVAQLCFEFFQDPREAIAVKVFSMTVLANIAAIQPDLKQEVRLLIEDQLPFASAGFVARAKKVLKQLAKI